MTIEEWLSVPEDRRAELIDGQLVHQAMPGPRHGRAQGNTFAFVHGPFDRKIGSGDKPGGWWFSQEVDMLIGEMGCRPDVVGWRRETCPHLPEPDARGLVVAPPDWICEVLSASTRHVDWGPKRLGYHRAGVSHYWLLDPDYGTLTVLRRVEEDYLVVLAASKDDVVRAEPFEAIELAVRDLLGEEEPANE